VLPKEDPPKTLGVVVATGDPNGFWLGAAAPLPNGLQIACPKKLDEFVAGVWPKILEDVVGVVASNAEG